MSQKYESPFIHYTIPNFLPDSELSKITKIYNNLEFFEKHTDLYKFLQTNELKKDTTLDFFKSNLLKLAHDLDLPEVEDIDLFASYYRKGDCLLCHDDLIDNRQYAFSYYLDDFDSGELIFYNKNADKEEKRISVTKNTCVIFQVSSISFHEVNYCRMEGRKAFTGWLNYDQVKEIIPCKAFEYRQIEFSQVCDFVYCKADLEKEINVVDDVTVSYNIHDEQMTGPFYSRRLILCNHSPLLFMFDGLDLFSKHVYKLVDGCYLLLNDSVNEIEGDVFDLFYFVVNEGVSISFVDEEGEVEFELEGLEMHGYLVQRRKRKIFIERTSKTCVLKHFIYHRTKSK